MGTDVKSEVGRRKTFYAWGNVEVPGEIYISHPGALEILKHKLIYALTAYATNFLIVPAFLREGIAAYLREKSNLIPITQEILSVLNYQALLQLEKSKNLEQNLLLYRSGQVIVYYLQENYPGLIEKYFSYYTKKKFKQAEELLKSALNPFRKIDKWLSKQVKKNLKIKKNETIEKRQSPFLQPAEYFSNNGNGYKNPYTFLIPEYNLQVHCYFNNLTDYQLDKIEISLSEYFKNFLVGRKRSSGDSLSSSHCYIFDNRNEYKKLGTIFKFGSGLEEESSYRYRISNTILDPLPYTKPEEYFSNDGKGYNNPHSLLFLNYNIQVKCYYTKLAPDQIKEINDCISEIIKKFFDTFPNSKHISPKLEIFNIYIFNNQADYNNLGAEFFTMTTHPGFGLIIAGEAVNSKTPEVHSEIYLSHPGKLTILQHELVHALTNYAVNLKDSAIPTFLSEGLAEYLSKPKLITLTLEECAGLDYQKLKKLEKSMNLKEQLSLYRIGKAIVYYLQENHPGLIEKYFTYLRKWKSWNEYGNFPSFIKNILIDFNMKNYELARRLLLSALSQPEKTKKWLQQRIREQLGTALSIRDVPPAAVVQQMASREADGGSPLDYGSIMDLSQGSEGTALMLKSRKGLSETARSRVL